MSAVKASLGVTPLVTARQTGPLKNRIAFYLVVLAGSPAWRSRRTAQW